MLSDACIVCGDGVVYHRRLREKVVVYTIDCGIDIFVVESELRVLEFSESLYLVAKRDEILPSFFIV